MAKLSDAARGFLGAWGFAAWGFLCGAAWGFLCAASVSFHAASSTLGVDGCGSPSSRAFAGSSEPPTSPDR
jgi:hypothetical protein